MHFRLLFFFLTMNIIEQKNMYTKIKKSGRREKKTFFCLLCTIHYPIDGNWKMCWEHNTRSAAAYIASAGSIRCAAHHNHITVIYVCMMKKKDVCTPIEKSFFLCLLLFLSSLLKVVLTIHKKKKIIVREEDEEFSIVCLFVCASLTFVWSKSIECLN